MKRLISVLIIVLTLFSLVGCKKNIFPKGYTGGLGIPFGSDRQIFWVETLEEAAEGATKLKERDSTFLGGYIFEGDDAFDVKYCFIFDNEMDKIEFGDDPYDRWASLVEIRAYGFYSDLSVDELCYSDIEDYTYITISFTELYYEKFSHGYIDPIFFECRWDEEEKHYYGSYGEYKIFTVEYNNPNNYIPSDTSLLTIFQSLIYVGDYE